MSQPRTDDRAGVELTDGADASFFINHHGADDPCLPLRSRPCGECPVLDGMYRGLSNDLARCAPDVVSFVTARWFCHVTPQFACRGNADNVTRALVAETPRPDDTNGR